MATTNADVGATVLIAGNLLFTAGLIAGCVVVAQSGWRTVAAAVVSADGNWVSVAPASDAFAERATAQLSRATAQPAPSVW